MALIKCEECGKDVSSRAAACPHCGCPVPDNDECVQESPVRENIVAEEGKTGSFAQTLFYMVCGSVTLVFVLFIVFYTMKQPPGVTTTADNRSVDELVDSLGAKTDVRVQKRTTKANVIAYKVLNKSSNKRGGGISMAVLVTQDAAKAEVMSLARHLRAKYISKGFMLINIFDLKEAFLRQGDEKYPMEKLYRHFLVQISVNPNTGVNTIDWVAEGRSE